MAESVAKAKQAKMAEEDKIKHQQEEIDKAEEIKIEAIIEKIESRKKKA